MALGLESLQGVYEASGTAPHITVDTTRGTPTIRADAAVTDIFELENSAGAVAHSWQDDSITMGTGVTDIFAGSLTGVNFTPSLFPTRPIVNLTLDQLNLLPTSRTFTSTINKITVGDGATFELDYVNATMAATILANYTAQYNQNGGLFGSGLVVNHSAVYQGDPGSTRTIGPIFTFVHQPRFRATGAGAAVTNTQGRDFLSQPVYEAVSGATSMTMSGLWTQFYGSGQVLTSATVNSRRIFYAGALAVMTGTTTDQTALLIDDLSAQTTNPAMGIQNDMATPGIQYEGSTGLYGIFSATPVGQQTVTGSRAGNAALASLLTAMANYGWVVDSTTA